MKMMKLLKIQSHGKNEQIRTSLKNRDMKKHFSFTKKSAFFIAQTIRNAPSTSIFKIIVNTCTD